MVNKTFKRGDQIVYVPLHMRSKWPPRADFWKYPNGFQPGFVWSGPNDMGDYFCRYWRWDYKTGIYVPELRTLANSEQCPGECLVRMDYFSEAEVSLAIRQIEKDQEAASARPYKTEDF